MFSIAINHNIWLTRDQRYSLHEGNTIVVVGVSLPVWVFKDKKTSEPAKEIFCKYHLKKSDESPIKILEDGYEITIPTREGTLPKISDEEWRDLNQNDPDKLEDMYRKCQNECNTKNLLDIKDGGSEYLNFREHNKISIDNELINFIHFVEVSNIEVLIDSLA